MRISITVEYNGKDFFGWQIQPGLRTVQGVLTEALSSLLRCSVILHGSGRTDAGVHALNQVAHFDYTGNFPIERLPLAVNTTLPSDVKVKSASVVSDDFNAQFSAKRKTYVYRFYLSKIPRPLIDGFCTQIPYSEEKFNFSSAEKAVLSLIGKHNFLAFSSVGRPVLDAVREIYSASLKKSDGIFTLSVTGNGFLYNMVRIIAGTIVEIGLGLLPESTVEQAFRSLDRKTLGATLPPHGLTLLTVEYSDTFVYKS